MFKKFTWGHGVILLLGSFIIFILSMIFLFTRGWQNAELVSNDYYKDELNYQQVIDAKNRAEKLAAKPQYSQDSAGITLKFPSEINNQNAKVSFELFRSDDERLDVKKEVALDGANSFTIPAKILAPGNYTLKLFWLQNKIQYQIDYDVVWKQL